jgi:hypothetical protein
MGKSPKEMQEAIIRNLPEKTGKSLGEWADITRENGPPAKKERIQWLKSEHGLGHVTAQIIAAHLEDDPTGYDDPDRLLSDMYAGPKQPLREIHERVVGMAQRLGGVKATTCKTYVALARKRQFAVIQPSTSDRVDLGLAMGTASPKGRLKASKSVGSSRITHAIALHRPEDVDGEVERLLKRAFDAAG